MHLGNIALGSIALMAASAFIFVAMIGSKGEVSSLRGSTKNIGLHASAKRALLKTFVYANKSYHMRRLQNTMVDCNKVNKIGQDALGCIFPSPGKGRGSNMAGNSHANCFASALVADGALTGDSALVNAIKGNAKDLLDARPGHTTLPKDKATKWEEDLEKLCKVKYGTSIDMGDLSLAEVSDDGISQELFLELLAEYFDSQVLPVCEDLIEDSAYNCDDFKAALETLLASANLGTTTPGAVEVIGMDAIDE